MRRRTVDTGLREDYTATVRRLAEATSGIGEGNEFVVELAWLEAGETVMVPGWAIGEGTDFSMYSLAADGSVTPAGLP